MRLIGMLDSPYVRRVAISLKLLCLPFELSQVSVLRQFDDFAAINPVVKAPTLITDDGVTLMDSGLILDHAERVAGRSLMPAADHARALRLVGLAMAACEKSVQIIYERNLRPAEKQHQPWLDRVGGQMRAAYGMLDAEIGEGELLQHQITAAVAWRFTQSVIPELAPAADYPALVALSKRAEQTQGFRETDFAEVRLAK